MRSSSFVKLFLLCVALAASGVSAGWLDWLDSHHYSRIRLRDVNAIVLHKDQLTESRRSKAVPQLKCTGRYCDEAPSSVMCKNMGFDGRDVTWKCEADLSNDVVFGKTEVSCEGYDHPNDEYILAGSCGLEYTLELSPEGKRARAAPGYTRYTYSPSYGQQLRHWWYQQTTPYHFGAPSRSQSSSSWSLLLVLSTLALGCYVAFKTTAWALHTVAKYGRRLAANLGDHTATGGQWPGFGFKLFEDPKNRLFSSGGVATNEPSGGPGFWTGLAGGSLLGWLFGKRYTNPIRPQIDPNFVAEMNPTQRMRVQETIHDDPSAPQTSGTRTAHAYATTKRR